MANRSDFAQKLLDDIRLRKEKLGYPSSRGQQRSAPPAVSAEICGSSKRPMQHTEATRTKLINNKQISSEIKGTRAGRIQKEPANVQGPSQDIVPLKRGTSLPNYVDVSMALALALSNSGKLQNMELFGNFTIGNELILHHGPLHLIKSNSEVMLDKMKQQRYQYPLNNLQISEISKGIQNLNRILEACPNMPKFQRDSYEIGKELLKGARDLEESLRMLMTLQDASDYMIGSQGKRTRLLKDKEVDKVHDKKIMTKPKFAYDKSSKSTHKLAKELDYDTTKEPRALVSVKPKWLLATGNANFSTQFISEYQSLSSTSSINNIKQTGSPREHTYSVKFGIHVHGECNFSSSQNVKQLNPKQNPPGERVRMPNVIARLMGLEDLPAPEAKVNKVEEQKDPKKETSICQNVIADEVAKEVNSKQRNFVKIKGVRKFLQHKNIEETKSRDNVEVMDSRGKTILIGPCDVENVSPTKNASKSHINLHEKIQNTNFHNIFKNGKFKKQLVHLKNQEEKGEQLSQRKEMIAKDVKKPIKGSLQQKTKQNQDAEVSKKSVLLKEQNKEENWLNLRTNQPKKTLNVSHQLAKVSKVTAKCALPAATKETEHEAKGMLTSTTATNSAHKPNNMGKSTHNTSMKKVLPGDAAILVSKITARKYASVHLQKEEENSNNQQYQHLTKSSTYTGDRRQASESSMNNKSLKKEPGTDNKALLQVPVTALDSPEQISGMDKAEIIKLRVDSNENHILDSFRSSESTNAGHHLKQQVAALNLLDKENQTGLQATGEVASFHETNSVQYNGSYLLPKNYLMDASGYREVAEEKPDAKATSGVINIRASNAPQRPELLLNADPELQSINLNQKSKGQIASRLLENHSILKWQDEASAGVKEKGSLTKNQYLLQQLNHNQQFLNTAQAIFKIDIPIDIPLPSRSPCLKDENQFLLDLGIDLLQQKGKREEVSYGMTKSYAYMKTRSLDSLLKELNNDLESLDVPNKPGGNDDDDAELLHMILEREIENRNPDINCMWDFGWSRTTFAAAEKDEVATNVVNQVTDDLIAELARDLLAVSTIFL